MGPAPLVTVGDHIGVGLTAVLNRTHHQVVHHLLRVNRCVGLAACQ